MTAAALALHGIRHAYGSTEVLHGVSLDACERQITCLLGPSGCGKSTLLRLAAGLEAPSAGTIHIGGHLVAGEGVLVPPERRAVGLLFQDFALFPHLTVADNVAFGLRRQAARAKNRKVNELLELTQLVRHRDLYPHMLSGGEQQRVALARALAPQPRVLLLDEPFTSLDTQLRNAVRGEMLQVLKEVGTAVVLVTHDPEEALLMADRIALMRSGHIVQAGEPAELYTHPADAFVAGFFGGINRIESHIRGGGAPSPLGQLPAPGVPCGTTVTCLIRPEAITLHTRPLNGENNPHAIVESARLLGGSSLICLATHPSRGPRRLLEARVPGVCGLRPGTEVWIELDPRLVHVFATSSRPDP